MITIIDYGLGNIRAFLNVYKRLNVEARSATTRDELDGATKIILPGVGHFDHAMDRLDASGMREPLDSLVLEQRIPVLGVCVGMQILARTSDEGSRDGLGWVAGHVRAFRSWEPSSALPLPHMGWNDVLPVTPHPLFDQLTTDSRFYFLHSYFFDTASDSDRLAVSSYGSNFASAVHSGNIYGVQFHPEKSHHFGTRLLQNFAEL
jgi:imidazole glycerol-phosphate synthase subunit HisH